LARNKLPAESFSQVIRRSFDKKKSIMDLCGAWADMSEEDVTDLKARINMLRTESKSRI